MCFRSNNFRFGVIYFLVEWIESSSKLHSVTVTSQAQIRPDAKVRATNTCMGTKKKAIEEKLIYLFFWKPLFKDVSLIYKKKKLDYTNETHSNKGEIPVLSTCSLRNQIE